MVHSCGIGIDPMSCIVTWLQCGSAIPLLGKKPFCLEFTNRSPENTERWQHSNSLYVRISVLIWRSRTEYTILYAPSAARCLCSLEKPATVRANEVRIRYLNPERVRFWDWNPYISQYLLMEEPLTPVERRVRGTRRAHTKSRTGCIECKRRKVKVRKTRSTYASAVCLVCHEYGW